MLSASTLNPVRFPPTNKQYSTIALPWWVNFAYSAAQLLKQLPNLGTREHTAK
jgi:hypothetical protein